MEFPQKPLVKDWVKHHLKCPKNPNQHPYYLIFSNNSKGSWTRHGSWIITGSWTITGGYYRSAMPNAISVCIQLCQVFLKILLLSRLSIISPKQRFAWRAYSFAGLLSLLIRLVILQFPGTVAILRNMLHTVGPPYQVGSILKFENPWGWEKRGQSDDLQGLRDLPAPQKVSWESLPPPRI